MTQQQIKGATGSLGSGGSLDVYDVPGSVIVTPYSVSATFDGSGAGGAFLPCLTFKTQTGAVIARCPAPEVAAGDTAEVSWFPGVNRSPAPVPGTGVPPAGNLDGYVFRKSNVIVTGLGNSSRTNLLTQGNAVTLDGLTSIKVEYWCGLGEIVGGVLSQGIGIELWDHFSATDVDKGTIALFENTQASLIGAPMYGTVSLTPAAGLHTYSIYGWKNVNSGTVTLYANTFVDGTGNIAPMWYRVTVIAYDATLPS